MTPKIKDLPTELMMARDLNVDIKESGTMGSRVEIPNVLAESSDPVIQSSTPAPLILSPITDFEGQSIFDSIALLTIGTLPPDTVGDVGPNHYVQVVNRTYRVYDKAGNPLTPARTLGSLWATIPGACANTNYGDPIVLYDSYADRWLISQFCRITDPNYHQLIAVSVTGNPTGAYYVYDFAMPNKKFNDYPKFGVWPDGYYMTDNQFNLFPTDFVGAGVFAFDRVKLLAGDPTASFIYFDLEELDPTIFGMLPSDADGLRAPPAGAPNVFVYFTADELGDPSDALRLFNFHADFATPANSTFIERSGSPLPVAYFDPRTPLGQDDIRQPPQPPPPANASTALDAIGDRLMHRLQFRNFGTHTSLVVNHTVNVGSGTDLGTYQAAIRYYELRSGGGAYSVNEQATFAPDATNRWMGSAAMDGEGNLAVGYSVSSTTVFPGIRYAARLASDPPGGLFQGEAILQAGGFVQRHESSRWGDYSSTNVDPTDDCTFWHTNEYYSTDDPTTTAEWHTRIGSFKVNPTCVAPARGTLAVRVFTCGSGRPVDGASINLDGIPYSSTLAGVSFIQLIPGMYSLVASAPGYLSSLPTNVLITNGTTKAVGVCITGAPKIATATTTILAESCSPADNAISPHETVTVDFGLTNGGAAATSHLVATLQSGGGVANPSGPQNYGSIMPDNTMLVSRPFTFTVDPAIACGSTITATFQLQDGADNLGTVSFILLVGTPDAPAAATYSSGNLAIPIPDAASVEIPINIVHVGSIQDVNVRVRLNHDFDGDVQMRLIHPDGTEILLVDSRGSSGDNFGTGTNNCSGTPTILDDAAGSSITSGVAPFAGSFKPQSPLSALNGKLTHGTWKLRVSDTSAFGTGTVGCVSLEVVRTQLICCGVAEAPDVVSGDMTIHEQGCNFALLDHPARVSLCVQNNGNDSTSNLVGTLLTKDSVIFPSSPQNYGAVAPGAPPVCRQFVFTVDPGAVCGELVPLTVQFQDGATNFGTLTYNFQMAQVVLANTVFSNTARIFPREAASSAPYPSIINVEGITGNVSKVTVKLQDIYHGFPDDIDVLLVGPGGQKLLLMSDAGGAGTTDLTLSTYTFDDTAAATLADSAINPTGTYKPSNFETGDTFPVPAPAGPYPDPQLLSIFKNVNPNGQWRLFAVDDTGGDSGLIDGGWTLNITTAFPVCCGAAGPPNADLSVTKSDSPDPTIAGQNVTYTINFINNGPGAANTVTVSDATPANTSFVSATVTSGSGWGIVKPASETGAIMFSKASVAAGETAVFRIVLRVNEGTPHNSIITNTAIIGSSTPDLDGKNSKVTTTTTVHGVPDLTIMKAHVGNFYHGQIGATYEITVTNFGVGPTDGPVRVLDILPVGLTPTGPIGSISGWNCNVNGQTVACLSSGPLPGNSSFPALLLTVNVANAAAPFNVTNTATVSAFSESNLSNNTAIDPTTVNCSPATCLIDENNQLVFSRVRANGPGGPQDEFVAIYNPGTTAHTVAGDNSAGDGYGVYASAGNGTTSNSVSLVCRIPNGAVIPARGYYLCTGATYSLGNLGRNGGAAGAMSVGDALIGCGGSCRADIPDDAGLALLDVDANIISLCSKGSLGCPTGFNYSSLTGSGNARVYDSVGFAPYGVGAPAFGYPSLAASFCEGTCLQPVGDASILGLCINPTGTFPAILAARACYGQSGQYELRRRQTTFDADVGTVHQDTNNNAADFIFISPRPGINTGLGLTGISGVTAVLGVAGPHNSNAPPEATVTKLTRAPFDGLDQFGPRNVEQHYGVDPSIGDPANNPLGTFTLRFRYTNNSGSLINGMRFGVNNLSTLCGSQTGLATVGTGEATNVGSSPNCGTGSFSAILKVLNSAAEVVVDSGGTARIVNGTVLEDLSAFPLPPGIGPLSPLGGGIGNTLVVNPSASRISVGDGVTGGTGNFSTLMGTSGPTNVLRIKIKFGVVRSGRFILLLVARAKTSPTP